MTDRAPHVENPLGTEVRVIVLDPSDDAIAHVGVVSAHLTHRIDVNRTVIHCTLGYVAINVFRVVAARLTMNIDGTVILGQWEVGIEPQRPGWVGWAADDASSLMLLATGNCTEDHIIS